MKKRFKQLLVHVLLVCLIFQIFPSLPNVNAYELPTYYGYDYRNPNTDIEQKVHGAGCRIYSIAMLLTQLGFPNAKPMDIYNCVMNANNGTTFGITSNAISAINSTYNVSFGYCSGSLSGTNDQKTATIANLLRQYPNGILISSPTNSAYEHMVYVFQDSNGNPRVHDPCDYSKRNCTLTTMNNAQVFLSCINKYSYITRNDTPAPPPSFTFDDKGVGGARGSVSETNAVIYSLIHTNITSGLECGIKLGTSSGNYSKVHSEALSNAAYTDSETRKSHSDKRCRLHCNIRK